MATGRQGAPNPLEARSSPRAGSWRGIAIVTLIVVAVIAALVVWAALD
jgi:hypothetical protein